MFWQDFCLYCHLVFSFNKEGKKNKKEKLITKRRRVLRGQSLRRRGSKKWLRVLTCRNRFRCRCRNRLRNRCRNRFRNRCRNRFVKAQSAQKYFTIPLGFTSLCGKSS